MEDDREAASPAIGLIQAGAGSSEAEMLAASGICQSEFLQKQEGFLLRLTARRDDGSHVDVCYFGKARPMLTLPWSTPSLQARQGSFLPIFSWTQKMPNQKMEHCA
jgi:hypothetical protein